MCIDRPPWLGCGGDSGGLLYSLAYSLPECYVQMWCAYIRMRWAWLDCQCVPHMLALPSCPLPLSFHGVRGWDSCIVARCTRWMLGDMYVDATLSRRGMPSVTTDSTASWLNSLHFGDMLD